jgi:DNA-binding XRE family transcriptional regulator
MNNRMKERREEIGMTQDQLSRKLRMSISWISRVENGKVKPSISLMIRIARALQCSVNDIFFD